MSIYEDLTNLCSLQDDITHLNETNADWRKLQKCLHMRDELRKDLQGQYEGLLAACKAFVEVWEKSHQLEKTDVALRMAKEAIARAEGE